MGKCKWSDDGFCQLFAIRYGNIHPACDGQVLPGQKNACRQGKLDLVNVRQPGDPPDPERKNHPGRGGRRAGAGAPRGNLNAIRSGAFSKQLKDTMIHQKSILAKARDARARRDQKS